MEKYFINASKIKNAPVIFLLISLFATTAMAQKNKATVIAALNAYSFSVNF